MWRIYLLLALLSMCTKTNAQQVCPWLTEGTAAALLGREVSSSVHLSGHEGTCEFTTVTASNRSQRAETGNLHMTINVGDLPFKDCSAGEQLTGVGQYAVFCSTDAGGAHREIIRGRVRSKYFQLTLTTRESVTPGKRHLRQALEQAAEEVAGNLF